MEPNAPLGVKKIQIIVLNQLMITGPSCPAGELSVDYLIKRKQGLSSNKC